VNHLATEDNLFRWHILVNFVTFCSVDCGLVEVWDHLFVNCDLYGRLSLFISSWLGISMAFHDILIDHYLRFGGLGGFFQEVSSDF
jgi:hypothetical protein